MYNEHIYTLEDRGILYVHGENVVEYLQNIITNDINKVTDSMSCFASLLTPQGKYLFDFIIVKHKKGYFIDCEKKQIDQLYKQLHIYKLRSKVEISNLSNEFVVAAISKEKFLSLEDSKEENGFTVKYIEDPIVLDPRNKELGGRLIINSEKLYLSIKKLELKTSESKDYYNFSFKLGIPPLHTDKLKNQLFGIECNFDELNGIDFKKGCYVGQENTSRIKLRNKLRRRILPIQKISGEITENDIIKFKNTEIGKIMIGKTYPFALIKVINPDLKEFANIELMCGDSKVKILKPDWI